MLLAIVHQFSPTAQLFTWLISQKNESHERLDNGLVQARRIYDQGLRKMQQ
jgi:hypothetical protein